jgi:hypothetical protein
MAIVLGAIYPDLLIGLIVSFDVKICDFGCKLYVSCDFCVSPQVMLYLQYPNFNPKVPKCIYELKDARVMLGSAIGSLEAVNEVLLDPSVQSMAACICGRGQNGVHLKQ